MAERQTKTSEKRLRSPRRRTNKHEPQHSQIAERAYFIHLQEGCADELQNWLRAERELRAA